MTSYDVLPKARTDIVQAVEYTRNRWGDAQVDRLQAAFNTAIQNIVAFPELGRVRADLLPGLRSIPVHRFLLFYVFDDGTIVIVRFLHQSRDLATLILDA